MADRRPLTDGIKPQQQVDSQLEKAFVYQNTSLVGSNLSAIQNMSRVPLSTRIRSDLAEALKRASLKRQLDKIEPNTLQDILEEAIEPWLKSHGFMT